MLDKPVISTFNRGLVSKLALARPEIERISMSAELQTNWIPRVLGPMTFRPGLEYIGEATGDGALLPFVYSADDTAFLELTASEMRVWISGTTLLTRPAVSASITNETFDTDLTGWTDNDDAGTTSQWATGGYMELTGTSDSLARRYQEVTVSGGEENTIHALRIVVTRGPVYLRVGSTNGDDDIFRQAVLRTGTHSIAIDPAGNSSFFIEFSSPLEYPVLVSECSLESSGTVVLPTPWTTADECRALDYEQSNDVIFVAGASYRQQRIERRDNNSWSVCDYMPDDGPFLTENIESITITPSAIKGSITLTASRALFRSDHVGALFRLSSIGQTVTSDLSSDPSFTDSIRDTGTGSERTFNIAITGTWVGTITLQRSIGTEGSWVDVNTYTANTTTTYNDSLDNEVVFYRIGFKSGDHTSGTATVTLTYASGSISGTALVTGYTSNTEVDAVVLRPLGGTDATLFWAEGAWSDAVGWPKAVSIWQGRLWWFKRGEVYGSESDAYQSFDQETVGDAGPLVKGFGAKGAQNPRWAIGMEFLVIGTDEAEYVVRSNALSEPVTPSNYNVRSSTAEGSYTVSPARMKEKAAFVDRSGQSVYEVTYDNTLDGVKLDHANVLIPELFDSNAYRMAAQRKPDERLHVVREDGTVAIQVRDVTEDVRAWCTLETDGVIEDVVVLPVQGQKEDSVFYRVRRTIDGSTVRYIERMARFDECIGGTTNKMADACTTGTGSITGLNHLEGEEVVIWGDGVDQGSGTVASGAVAGASYDNWCVGLAYRGRYKSTKLAMMPRMGVMLNERSRIHALGLILADTHTNGLKYGQDFDVMDDLPLVEDAATVTAEVYSDYDEDFIEVPGDWGTDSRLCLEANAPRNCTVMAASIWMSRETNP